MLTGYRNMNPMATSVTECIRPRNGINDQGPNYLYFGEWVGHERSSKVILVDCLFGKINQIEQRSIKTAREVLQLRKR